VKFLIDHEVDKDARDHNGYTALHLASLVGAQSCAALLLDAGADVEIVNVKGKTAQELADFNFADLLVEDTLADSESRWGDGEESGDEPDHNRAFSRVLRRSVDPAPSSPHDDSDCDHPVPELATETKDGGVDEKRAATFMRKIQRTLARVQPKDSIIPNMPYLALPQLLPLPGMPGVPWGALPAVFPAYVPWTGSLRIPRASDNGTNSHDAVPPKGKVFSLLTPQEWRTFLEKSWLVQGAQTSMQMHEGESPPVYTPRADDDGQQPVPGPSIAAPERPITRQVGYDTGPAPDDQVVNSYKYLPPRKKHTRQIQNKEDRMLLLFWIPILILALLWALVHGVRIAIHSVRTTGPLRAILRSITAG